jgi:thymidylate synthase
MNTIDKKYTDLLQDILDNGVTKQDRTGTGTLSVFGRQIRHKMSEGFPLLTTKKMYFKGIVTELLWFLRGDTNIKYLVDNDCHIWDGDAYKNYLKNWKPQPVIENELHWMEQELVNDRPLPKDMFIHCIKKDAEFAERWGELGPIYGKQWRSWNEIYSDWEKFDGGGVDDGVELKLFAHKGLMTRKKIKGIDQIANLINDLKTNPDSRRLMVTAWNPSDLELSVLPPCHYGFQVYTRELSDDERQKWVIDNVDWVRNAEDPKHEANKYLYRGEPKIYGDTVPKRAISLMWNQRSCDFPLGIPANIMSYAILLMMLAKQVNMVPEELIGNFGDCHIYLNQIDGVKEQLTKEPYPLPSVKLSDKVVNDLSEYTYQDIILENYQSHPKIYFPLSN